MKEFKTKPLKGLEDLGDERYSLSNIAKRQNGTIAASKVNNEQGKKNAKSGHMKSIQSLGASLGGKIIAMKNVKSGELKKRGLNGARANKEKYGIRISSTNLITGESVEHISIGEAESYTKVQSVIITKILRGLQPKTRNGWVFTKINP